jgi:hypothetical protein
MKFNSQEKLRLTGQFKRGKEARKRKRGVALTGRKGEKEKKGEKRENQTHRNGRKSSPKQRGMQKSCLSPPPLFFYL